MNVWGMMTTINDADLRGRSIAQGLQQLNNMFVSVAAQFWEGYVPEEGVESPEQALFDLWDLRAGDPFRYHNLVTSRSSVETEVLQRNQILDHLESMGTLEPGDIVVRIDADEVWPQEHIGTYLQYLFDHPEVESLAVPFLNFWGRGDHVMANADPDLQYRQYTAHTRFWRYIWGSRFRTGGRLERVDGTLYPEPIESLVSFDELGERPGHRYKWVRDPIRCKQEWEHLRFLRGESIRSDWYHNVYLRCVGGATLVNGGECGISLVTDPSCKLVAIPYEVEHPAVMQGYEYL